MIFYQKQSENIWASGQTWALPDMQFERAGFELSPYLEMVQPMPAPTEILDKICTQFLPNHTAAILYLTDSETYGRDSVASQAIFCASENENLWGNFCANISEPPLTTLQTLIKLCHPNF